MKKLIALTICLSLFAAGAAMAADGTEGASGVTVASNTTLRAKTPSNTPIAKASKNVFFGWYTGATGYAITTFHSTGTKSYGTASDSTKIYFKDATAIAAPTSSLTTTAFAAGTWTAM